MDNKKWYKKFSTIFWWSLTILPFIMLLFAFIIAVGNLTLNEQTLSSSQILAYINDLFNSNNVFDSCLGIVSNMALPPLTNMFKGVFNNLNIAWFDTLGCAFGFMLSVQCYHVLFDVVVWLPHMAHELMERWC